MRTPTRKSRIAVARGERLVRPLLVAALTVGLVVAGSSDAQARSVTDFDTAGDMVGTNDEHQDPHPTPNQVRNDALRTTMAYGARRISIRVKYAEMRRLDDGHGQSVQMVTNQGIRRNLDISADSRHWAGRTQIWRGRDGGKVRCAIRHQLDYTNNLIAVNFPRRCVGNPRWVKFRVVGFRFLRDGDYYDDALRDAPFLRFLGDNSAQSRRVYRASAGP
jgi:hypothetical protein